MKTSLILIVTLFTLTLSYAQRTDDLEAMAYKAYLTQNKSLWKLLVKKRQQSYNKVKSQENLYELVLSQHGLLNACMADQDEGLFNAHYDSILDNIDELINEGHEAANAKALQASTYGMEMAFSPWKGIFLGVKSSNNLEEAKKIDPGSPLVWAIYAKAKLFTPPGFGGDKKEAVNALEKAVELYEMENTINNWRYLDALAWLGQAYQQIEESDKAITTYQKALKVEPDFLWVKRSLLPKAKAQ